jgi:phosphoribosylformylglycinamidine synthase
MATGGGSAILPTPAIGGIGLLADVDAMATVAFKGEGEDIVLIGDTANHLGQSLWLREVQGREAGDAPTVDLTRERQAGDLVRALVAAGDVTAVHDVSDGGLLVTVAEMALAGGIGSTIEPDWASDTPLVAQMFGEDQGRFVVTGDAEAILARAAAAGLPARRIGVTGGDAVAVGNAEENIGWATLADLRAAHEGFFPALMGSEL